jgi:hypothetical protein
MKPPQLALILISDAQCGILNTCRVHAEQHQCAAPSGDPAWVGEDLSRRGFIYQRNEVSEL